MASHRKPRPGGTHGAGIRTPALATAALTSVAVLSQTAEAAPAAGDGRPSVEEIERKIDDFYRRAESGAETSASGRERTEWAQEAERARQAERAERAQEAERAEDSRRRADSLQRLRDEVARRAQGRGLPAQRAAIPAQRGPGQARHGSGQARLGSAPAPDTAPAAFVSDTGVTPSVPSASPTPSVRDAAPASPVRNQDITSYARDTGITQPVRDRTAASPARDARPASPLRHTAVTPGGKDPAYTPSLRDTTVTPPARQTGNAPATPAGAGKTSADGLPETAASGPKAAKARVRKKLAHARVLLAQRAAQGAGTPSGTYASKARKAIAFARAQLGKPCLSGTAGPGSYDCSGLVQAAWKSAGVVLPRTAREQAATGTPVPPDQIRPGDLVFFHDDVSHVGICTGDGMMIHAPRPGAYVREESVFGAGEAAVHSVVRPG
ncbi:NlpC/P60 family protein [Streptomyces sp. Caat 7-52]|uniref:C40 family peptidase n=1 Tax=Streptomyces sp. Caat 7-52 TaxID=2949637 RepID=UPI002035F34A|nr:NlpC/P60 family protein [Streptomyces sp. Caat 7-52]